MDKFERFKKMAKEEFGVDVVKTNTPSSFEELFNESGNICDWAFYESFNQIKERYRIWMKLWI